MKITIGRKEGDRLVAIRAVDAGQITQEQAAQQLGISVRQVCRSLIRYREEGGRRGAAPPLPCDFSDTPASAAVQRGGAPLPPVLS